MVREIIKPTSDNYNIQIPKEYVNKKIEILIFPFSNDEESENVQNGFDPKRFYNSMHSSKTDIDNYLNNSKADWDNNV